MADNRRKAYPFRIVLPLTKEQFRFVKAKAREHELPVVEIIRTYIDARNK